MAAGAAGDQTTGILMMPATFDIPRSIVLEGTSEQNPTRCCQSSTDSRLSLLTDLKRRGVMDYEKIQKWGDSTSKLNFECLQFEGLLQYRGEGNSNIVLALAEGSQVIRLPKVKSGENFSRDDWSSERKKLEREVAFANNIFGPMIGEEFVGKVDILQITATQIAELNQRLRPLRPENRRHKELGIPFATTHADFAMIKSSTPDGVSYCVEIKPKQGWWSKSILGEPTELCTFCLNQFLKLKLGKVSTHSGYCPLNLFSADPVRMVHAVIELINTPQNNFRIFRNGIKVYGDDLSDLVSLYSILEEWFSACSIPGLSGTWYPKINDEPHTRSFIYILCVSLIRPLVDNNRGRDSDRVYADLKREIETILRNYSIKEILLLGSSKEKCCNAESKNLPEGSILSRVLFAQKLGKWGSGHVYTLHPKICPVHRSASRSGLGGSVNCPSQECLGEDKWLDEIDCNALNELDYLCIEHYLLAATAKDLSVMITFSPGDFAHANNVIEDCDGGRHTFRIGVADLDPKPFTSIARHYLRDSDMCEAFHQVWKLPNQKVFP